MDAEKKAKILVVEDEEVMRGLLTRALQGAGYEVYEAENGEQGLVISQEVTPDIILLDLVMPIMGGLEMLGKLREDEWGSKANVMILTNNDSKAKREEAGKYSPLNYLVKSDVDISDIKKILEETLQSRVQSSDVGYLDI